MLQNLLKFIPAYALVGLLVTVALVPFSAPTCGIDSPEMKARRMKQIASIHVDHQFKTPLIAYRLDVGTYPSSSEGLNALLQPPKGKEGKWKGPYIEELPLDPWENPYQYRYPGLKNDRSYDLFSYGPDGVQSDDDIGNWVEPQAPRSDDDFGVEASPPDSQSSEN